MSEPPRTDESGTLPTPEQLIAALDAAGFVRTRSSSSHVTFDWPESEMARGSLTVPLGAMAEDDPFGVETVMEHLEMAFDDGQAAEKALAVLRRQGVTRAAARLGGARLAAYLVIHPRGGIGWSGISRDRAHEYARNTGSVVVEMPAAADYRAEETR